MSSTVANRPNVRPYKSKVAEQKRKRPEKSTAESGMDFLLSSMGFSQKGTKKGTENSFVALTLPF
jgi:hypothetical protein